MLLELCGLLGAEPLGDQILRSRASARRLRAVSSIGALRLLELVVVDELGSARR